MENYLNQNIFYNNYCLLDETGETPIMMDWETDMMKKSAEIICKNDGDVLNVGFGMGIIDGFIEQYNISSHTIIEPHPVVIQKMKNEGWFEQERVNILEGRWQSFFDELPKFDGVYFDTSPAESSDEHMNFLTNVHKILKPGGILCFFHTGFFNPGTKNMPRVMYEVLRDRFDISSEKIILNIESYILTKTEKYWNPNRKKCWIPKCVLKFDTIN